MFGKIIKNQIEYFNLSQKELAIKTNLSEQLISEVISEKRKLTLETALKLEKAFYLRKLSLYEVYLNICENKQKNEDNDLETIIKFVEEQDYYKLMAKESIYEEVLSILGTNNLKEKKVQIDKLVKGFYRYKNKSLAYFWISILEKKYAHLISSGSFRKTMKSTVIKGALDIMINDTNVEDRINSLKKFLDKHGIILINAPFIPNSTINGVCFKRNTQRFIFMSDKQKREYSYIFTLIHELLHYYSKDQEENEELINYKTAQNILNYLNKYQKNHPELELAIRTFNKKTKNGDKWKDLRDKTNKKINFGEVSSLFKF